MINLKIITPSGTYLSQSVEYLEVRAPHSVLGILPGHAPLVSTLLVAPLKTKVSGKTYYYAAGSGVLNVKKDEISCFLAGGMTSGFNWQDKVIKEFRSFSERDPSLFDQLVLINPRRKFFDVGDVRYPREQIEWEYEAIERSTIFSMFFADGESVQPISLYELGRKVGSFADHYISIPDYKLIVTIVNGYKKAFDVVAQLELATKRTDLCAIFDTRKEAIENHCTRIMEAYSTITSGTDF